MSQDTFFSRSTERAIALVPTRDIELSGNV
ncbi:hypothetical protein GGR16_005183 [Chelatococcus caeni]|uniref:Uncharacterized protein n=1 Tax=Chelatococcus caeni TaxID=1348468 RepID=A0A840C9S4_9HYPH|nr:hypothetical protein [Chelatococcus caeni]